MRDFDLLAGFILAVFLIIQCTSFTASAEPYLAINSGQKCMMCHVNPTGGGKRTEFGMAYAETLITEQNDAAKKMWNGVVTEALKLGGNLRTGFTMLDADGQEDISSFDLQRLSLYFEFSLLQDKLTLYADEKIAPSGAESREAFVLLWLNNKKAYLKAGRMFLPYGLRLEDDTAFIRRVPSINFSNNDSGVELGFELAQWSLQLAVSNGAGGGAETDRDKQISAVATYIQPGWRMGTSYNTNQRSGDVQDMANLFLGLKTGNINWLAEIDRIDESSLTGGVTVRYVSLIESNIAIRQGHNLKLTVEHFDPDDAVADNLSTRLSVVWEYFPLSFTQLRFGVRATDEPVVANLSRDTKEIFLQWHAFF